MKKFVEQENLNLENEEKILMMDKKIQAEKFFERNFWVLSEGAFWIEFVKRKVDLGNFEVKLGKEDYELWKKDKSVKTINLSSERSSSQWGTEDLQEWISKTEGVTLNKKYLQPKLPSKMMRRHLK